jgi:hypothetical protein
MASQVCEFLGGQLAIEQDLLSSDQKDLTLNPLDRDQSRFHSLGLQSRHAQYCEEDCRRKAEAS